MTQSISKVIHQALHFLQNEQQEDGSFLSYSSATFNPFTQGIPRQTAFFTSLILDSLQSIHDTLAHSISKKAAAYLLAQASPSYSFNYWSKSSPDYLTNPYPDDLDDTFCALAALYRYEKKTLTPKILASITNLLTALEVTPGGPYRTWVVPATAEHVWLDTDLIVNTNIAYFLSLLEIELPAITAWTEEAIKNNRYSSAYYTSFHSKYYFISRWYRGSLQEDLTTFILKQKIDASSWETPLATALSISSLLRLGSTVDVTDYIQFLLNSCEQGVWPAEAFYPDPIQNKTIYYAGSASLTTAFCLEALALYQTKPVTTAAVSSPQLEENALRKACLNSIQVWVSKFPSLTQQTFKQYEERILLIESRTPILTLPLSIINAIDGRCTTISFHKIQRLGCATFYGWLAYTIYDSFLDEEGSPPTLPLANLAYREMLEHFSAALPRNAAFRSYLHHILDRIEIANIHEVIHYRASVSSDASTLSFQQFPLYLKVKELSERSLGHLLAPIIILFHQGYFPNSPEVQDMESFFQHFLTARQLHDDAHDWEKDIQRGHLSYVVVFLLRRYFNKNAPNHELTLPFSSLLPELRVLFWREVIIEISQTILCEIQAARQILKTSSIIHNSTPLETLLTPLQASAEHTLNEQKMAVAFLANYYDKN